MQWDSSENAGFTTGRPWLPLDPGFRACNVETLKRDPASILTLYRRLIELRRRRRALSIGGYVPVDVGGHVFAYERRHGGERLLVALNLWHEPHDLPLVPSAPGRVLLSTHLDRDGEAVERMLSLRPDEGVIVELSS
jgi:alpha-glucosidase